MTIDDLGVMIAEGFAETATKKDVAGLEKRIDGIDDRLISVEGSLTKVDDRLTIVENKLDQALYREFGRIDQLENKMKTVYDKLGLTL